MPSGASPRSTNASAVAQCRYQGKVRLDLQLDGAVARRDQHQAIAENVAPRRRLNQIAFLQIVHPIDIGREEHVGRRAAFDLPRKSRARGE
jgi:hypothetical protein